MNRFYELLWQGNFSVLRQKFLTCYRNPAEVMTDSDGIGASFREALKFKLQLCGVMTVLFGLLAAAANSAIQSNAAQPPWLATCATLMLLSVPATSIVRAFRPVYAIVAETRLH